MLKAVSRCGKIRRTEIQREGHAMRTISAAQLTDAIARLCIRANTLLPEDVDRALEWACHLSLIHI